MKKKKKIFHPKRVMSQRINRDGQSVVVYFFDLIKERERERERNHWIEKKFYPDKKRCIDFHFFRVDIFHKEIEHNDTTTNHPPIKQRDFFYVTQSGRVVFNYNSYWRLFLHVIIYIFTCYLLLRLNNFLKCIPAH